MIKNENKSIQITMMDGSHLHSHIESETYDMNYNNKKSPQKEEASLDLEYSRENEQHSNNFFENNSTIPEYASELNKLNFESLKEETMVEETAVPHQASQYIELSPL